MGMLGPIFDETPAVPSIPVPSASQPAAEPLPLDNTVPQAPRSPSPDREELSDSPEAGPVSQPGIGPILPDNGQWEEEDGAADEGTDDGDSQDAGSSPSRNGNGVARVLGPVAPPAELLQAAAEAAAEVISSQLRTAA